MIQNPTSTQNARRTSGKTNNIPRCQGDNYNHIRSYAAVYEHLRHVLFFSSDRSSQSKSPSQCHRNAMHLSLSHVNSSALHAFFAANINLYSDFLPHFDKELQLKSPGVKRERAKRIYNVIYHYGNRVHPTHLDSLHPHHKPRNTLHIQYHCGNGTYRCNLQTKTSAIAKHNGHCALVKCQHVHTLCTFNSATYYKVLVHKYVQRAVAGFAA